VTDDKTTKKTLDAVMSHVRDLVSRQQYDTWFRSIEGEAMAPDAVVLSVDSAFVRDWLSTYYDDVLRKAIALELDITAETPITIHARRRRDDQESEPDPTPEPTPPPAPEPGPTSAGSHEFFVRHSDIVLNRQYRFENFVVGPSNQLAHAASMAVANSPASSYNPLFLHGDVGLGKTHLLQAVCHQIMEHQPTRRILYLTSETFVNQFISAVANGELARFRYKYREVDVLLIDDIHMLANKERTQEEFFHTFNALYNADRQIVLSSDSPPSDIPTMKERLISRFKWGLVAELAPPGYETRLSILRRKAEARGVLVPEDVLKLLAEHVNSNIRELEGAITKVVGYAQLINKPIDLDIAHAALGSVNGYAHRAVTSIDRILEIGCRHFGVRVSDLQGRKRTQSIALPRQVTMYLVRRMTPLSLEEIGGYFGGRDHSTVLYAVDKVAARMKSDTQFAQLVVDLERQVRS